MMRWYALAVVLLAQAASAGGNAPAPKPPLKAGSYTFQHRYAEQPTMGSFTVRVHIKGQRITVVNPHTGQVFPKGVIAKGLLLWNAPTGQWIIGETETDRDNSEVGGCSAGPEVVDLVKRIYWTC